MGYLEARVTKSSTKDKTTYDEVFNDFIHLQYTDEVNGPGSGQVTMSCLDPKIVRDPSLMSVRNLVTVLSDGQVQGRFLMQSRELMLANGAQKGDLADEVWVMSGEGLRTLLHDAVVFPENGSINKTTPSNRNFNFSTVTKSRWYNPSQWKKPVVGPKYLEKGSNFGKWPTSWPITNGNWIWGDKGININDGVVTPGSPTTSAKAVNDYPWPTADHNSLSPLRYNYRNCTDFVAWRLNRDNGVTHSPWKYTWSVLRPNGGDGDAIGWKEDWTILGWQTDIKPVPGCVAYFGSKVGTKGHVAYVQSVSGSSVTLEEMNWGGTFSYGTRTIPASQVDSFLQAPPGTPAPKGGSSTSSGTHYDGANSPIGTCYFRGTFTVDKQGQYDFYAAADDSMVLYLDGAQIASTAAGHSSWDTTTSSTGVLLDPGTHVFAASVFNAKGRGGFIGAVRRQADPGATVTVTTTKKLKSGKSKTTTTTKAATASTVIVTGDSNWTVCAYPAIEPGWTPGEVMLQLWGEAQKRGVEFPNYLKPTFSADHDSYGKPWPSTTTYTFGTNTEYFDVVHTIEGLIADVYIDPRDFTFNMYVQQGVDHTGDLGQSGPATTTSGAPIYSYLDPQARAATGPKFQLSILQRMQDFSRYSITGDFYVTQEKDPGAAGQLGDTNVEDVWITRVDASGTKLDSMTVIDAGHGSEISVESSVSGGTLLPYIWMTVGTSNELLRFQYKPGTYTRAQLPGVTVMPKFGHTSYVAVQFDWQNNWVAMQYGLDPVDNYELRKIDELKAGVNHVYATLNLHQGNGIANQGFLTYQQSLFRWTGGANDPHNPPTLTQYNWYDGSIVSTFDASSLGKDSSGNYPGNWYEPEGAALYDLNGTPTLYLGYTFNPYGSHTFQTWTIPLRTQQEAETKWVGSVSSANPPTLRLGQNVTTADETAVGALKNGLLIQTADGWVYKTDNNSVAQYGRIEGGAQVSVNTDQSDFVINSTFKLLSTPNVSTTYQITTSQFIPGTDFRVGDWVMAPALTTPSASALEKRRVMSITYSADTTNNLPTALYAVELDTVYQDRITILNRLIQRLNQSNSVTSSVTPTATGGSTGAGDSAGTAGGGSGSYSTALAPPQNFAVETNQGDYDSAGRPITLLDVDWDVPLDDDGSAADVAHYEIYGSGPTEDWHMLLRVDDVEATLQLPVNEDWTLAVRAIAGWDNAIVSEFSDTVLVTTTQVLTPLDPPSAPVVSSHNSVVSVIWDGFLVSSIGAQEAPPPQMAAVRVKVWPDGNPAAAQIMGQPMSVAGTASISGLTVGSVYQFELVAQDTVGLTSAPSVAVAHTVQGVDLGSLDADLAAQVANKKSASTVFSSATPGTDWQRDGVLWFDTSAGDGTSVIKRWNAAASAWQQVPMGAGGLGPNSIVASNIAAGQVSTAALAAGAVTADTIGAGAIISQKIEAGAVLADKIATKAVTADKIDVGAVTAQNLVVGAAPVPSTDRVNNQPTDTTWWQTYALPKLAPGGAGIPNWTYTNENSRVSSTAQGLVFDTTTGQRAIIGLTAMYPVPPTRKITVNWAGTGTLPIRIRENDPTAAGGVNWSSYPTKPNSVFAFGPGTTSYGVYVEVPPSSGTSVLVSIHVFEVIGSAGGGGRQGVELSPGGIVLTNWDGSERVTLGTDSKDVFQITDNDGVGNPNDLATIGNDGSATFQALTVQADASISGSNLIGTLASNLADAQANGTAWPVGGIGDTSALGLLDIPGRSVTYQAKWNSQNSSPSSISTRYYFIASASFQVEDGRMVMLLLNNGGLAVQNGTDKNIYARLQVSLTQFNNYPIDGSTVASSVVYSGTKGGFSFHPSVWSTQVMATPAIDYANYILPAGVPIYWQYYMDLSGTPNTSYSLDEYGQYRGLNVIDLGSNAVVGGQPAAVTDGRGPTPPGSQTGPPTSNPGTNSITKTFKASASGSFRTGGTTPVTGNGVYTDSQMLYQGVGVTAMGALFVFPALALPTNATVTKVQLYLRNRHTGTGNSVTVHLSNKTNNSVPSQISGSGSQTYSWAAGQGKWVTLPSSWNTGIGSGATRSFQIGVDSTSANYAYFDGVGKSDPPQLRVTFH